MSLLISLCAGKSQYITNKNIFIINNLKYTASKECFVTNFRILRLSARNLKYNYSAFTNNYVKTKNSSETLCENFLEENNINILKSISFHRPIHQRPLTDNQFGYYLAGLIEGDGCFIKGQIIICFHENDTFLAYYLKKRIGFGNVYKIKNKRAVKLIISNLKGLIKITELINGKLHTDKVYKFNNNIINYINSKINYIKISKIITYNSQECKLSNNYWLAGFSDADSSFQIKIIKRINRKTGYEVRLNYQVDQKKPYILNLLKKEFGGYVGYRKSQDTYYYGSTSFKSAYHIINYFDKYHLQSSKYINYCKWRKIYYIIMKKEHITDLGIKKIKGIDKK